MHRHTFSATDAANSSSNISASMEVPSTVMVTVIFSRGDRIAYATF
jgi:hypothetical protein